jgi:hypothetical protein
MRLQNTVSLHADETAASFASRLAAANGLPNIAELLLDAEHSMAGFLKGDLETFKTLAALEPPPLKWSAPIVRKAADQRWRLRDPSRKRLS